CDDCQEVCPVGRAERVEDGIEDPAADVEAIAVLEAADDELMERFGRWYVAERDPRYLRRNALVALGNTGSAADPSTVRMLNNYLSHHDSLLRAHAVWAASRLGRSDLLVDHPDRGPRGDLEVAEELRLSDVRVGP
ncbi:MAG TPA: hypothetical protein DGF10_08820, partial [Acidimicrobiaceae bacterium]|nr:hypothetical protein [Acidimicrobiaceae bacterium]